MEKRHYYGKEAYNFGAWIWHRSITAWPSHQRWIRRLFLNVKHTQIQYTRHMLSELQQKERIIWNLKVCTLPQYTCRLTLLTFCKKMILLKLWFFFMRNWIENMLITTGVLNSSLIANFFSHSTLLKLNSCSNESL